MDLSSYLEQRGAASDLAERLGVPPVSVSHWSRKQRTIPIVRCVQIEKLTNGAVTRKDLRPDDWHEIWPELAKKQRKK